MTREETRAYVASLDRERRTMAMANRYIQHGQGARLAELGIDPTEAARVLVAGGYGAAEFTKLREKIRWHRSKIRRRAPRKAGS